MAASSSSSSSSSTAAVQQLWLNDDQLARYFELEDEEDEEGDDSEPERKSLAASTPPPPPSASNVRSLSASKPATRSAPEQTLTSSSSSSLKRRWQATDEHDVDAKVRRVASASHSTPPVTRNLHSSSQLEIQTMQGAIDQKMQCAIEAHHQLQARKNTLSVGPLRDLASLSVAERFENRVLGDKRFNDMGMCQLAGILPSAGDLALKQKALPQLLVVPSATTEKSRVWRLGSRLNTVDMVAVVKGSKTLVRSEQYLDLLAIKLSDLDMRLSATTGLPVNVPAAAIYETGGQRASRMTCSRSTVDNQLILHDDLLVFHKAGIRWFCAQAKDGVAFAIGRRTPMTTNNAHPSEFKPHLLPMDENGARYEQLLWIVANTKTYAAQLAFLEEHMSDPKTAGGEWAYGDYTRGASQILRGLYSAAPHERQANELGMRLVQSSLRPSRTSIRAEGIRVMSELSNKMDHQTRAEIDEPIVATAASSFASECRGVTGQASIELAMCRDRQAAMEWMVSKTATNSTDALSVEASNFAHASYATFQAVVDVHKAFLCSTAAASSVLGFKKHGDLELAKKRDRQIAMAIEWHSEDHPTSCKFSILVSAKLDLSPYILPAWMDGMCQRAIQVMLQLRTPAAPAEALAQVVVAAVGSKRRKTPTAEQNAMMRKMFKLEQKRIVELLIKQYASSDTREGQAAAIDDAVQALSAIGGGGSVDRGIVQSVIEQAFKSRALVLRDLSAVTADETRLELDSSGYRVHYTRDDANLKAAQQNEKVTFYDRSTATVEAFRSGTKMEFRGKGSRRAMTRPKV